MVGHDGERVEDLVEHLPVLRGDDDPHVVATGLGCGEHERRHLHRLGARTERDEQPLHEIVPGQAGQPPSAPAGESPSYVSSA